MCGLGTYCFCYSACARENCDCSSLNFGIHTLQHSPGTTSSVVSPIPPRSRRHFPSTFPPLPFHSSSPNFLSHPSLYLFSTPLLSSLSLTSPDPRNVLFPRRHQKQRTTLQLSHSPNQCIHDDRQVHPHLSSLSCWHVMIIVVWPVY